MRSLDATDLRILRAMQENGDSTVSEIAELAGISQSPCSRRIAQLHADGIIIGKAVLLDERKLGFQANFLVRIKLKAHDRDTLDAFKAAVLRQPEIQTAVLVLGEFDFHLQVVARDIEHYHQLLQDSLVALPGVREMQTSVIVETMKSTTALPL